MESKHIDTWIYTKNGVREQGVEWFTRKNVQKQRTVKSMMLNCENALNGKEEGKSTFLIGYKVEVQ